MSYIDRLVDQPPTAPLPVTFNPEPATRTELFPRCVERSGLNLLPQARRNKRMVESELLFLPLDAERAAVAL